MSRRRLLKAAAGAVGVVAAGVARPPAAVGAVGGGHGGNLGAITKQLSGTGLFIGNEFLDWSDTTRRNVFAQIGCDLGMMLRTGWSWNPGTSGAGLLQGRGGGHKIEN